RNPRNKKENRQSTVARAFVLRDGREALIVSNRSGREERIRIYRNEKPFGGPFQVQSMGGTDPARLNFGEISDMDVELREERGTIVVPPYGVISVIWEIEKAGAPDTPENLKTDPMPGGVHLSWDPVPGATAYRVLYGVAPERWVRESVVPNGSTFEVGDLEPGYEYAFSVTAIGSEGESLPTPTQMETAGQKYRYAPLESIPTQTGSPFWIPSMKWKNPEVVVEFQFDFEVTINSPPRLFAREDSSGNSFALGCAPVPGGQEVQLFLEQMENGTVSILAESEPLTLKEGEWNQLRFELDEAVLRGWLNDRLVVATQLDPPWEGEKGKVGILSPEAGVELRNFGVR
ncbi:MAG: fibronectin type III domain-containing protein, partial [Planctomycetota bacterium]|nr:fibronectin type III domain-containing protein [Planctomycetota bacterium]